MSVWKNSFAAVEVPTDVMNTLTAQLRAHVGKERGLSMVAKREERDGVDIGHVTVVSPREWRKLSKGQRDQVCGVRLDFRVIGLGKQSNCDGDVIFAVCVSDQAAKLRESLGLPPHDFHVTVGFDVADIHGAPKDASTLLTG